MRVLRHKFGKVSEPVKVIDEGYIRLIDGKVEVHFNKNKLRDLMLDPTAYGGLTEKDGLLFIGKLLARFCISTVFGFSKEPAYDAEIEHLFS